MMPSRSSARSPRTSLLALLALASVVVAALYALTSGNAPRTAAVEDPRLDVLDRTGDKPRALWRDDDFDCLGWRATFDCDPHGARDTSRDRTCDQPLSRVSGYCEVRNRTSGAVYRVMLATCSSWWWKKVPALTCNDARTFTDFSIRAAAYRHTPPLPPPPLDHNDAAASAASASPRPRDLTRGIAMIAYPKVIAGVYAIVRMLRYHGCALPIEVWIDASEMQPTHSILLDLAHSADVVVRTIADPSATQFHAKPYVVYHSMFESVLFLDSDNIPLRDPTDLFASRAFQAFGAVFWPDFWQPMGLSSPFNVHAQSAVWQLLDMPFIDMFEQESGQVLVNRSRSRDALDKLMFYASAAPRALTDWSLVYGDKDLFRLAWLNTTTPFGFMQHLLALGGLYDGPRDRFCGVAMLQQDERGDFVFMHRNQVKLSGRKDQRVVVTHYEKFTGGDGDASSLSTHLAKYRVECARWRLGQRMCFYLNPVTAAGDATPRLVKSLASTKIPQLEQRAIHFSIEGRSLLTKDEEAELAALEAKDQTSSSAWTIGAVVGLAVLAIVVIGMAALAVRWRYEVLPLRWHWRRRHGKDRRFSI